MNVPAQLCRQLRPSGFSLVELLTVLGILGVMVSIVLPHITSTNDAARQSVARRNAQTLAAMFACGQVAGVKWGATDVSTAVNSVFTGKVADDGAFAGKAFKVAAIAATELPDAMRYLRWGADNTLTYTQTAAP